MRNLRIVLTQEKVSYILDTPKPGPIGEDALEEEKATYKMWQIDGTAIKIFMLASISNELQRQHDGIDPKSILLNLKELYGEESGTS